MENYSGRKPGWSESVKEWKQVVLCFVFMETMCDFYCQWFVSPLQDSIGRSRSVEADRRETGQSRRRYPGLKRERSLQDIDKVALAHCLKVIEKYHEGHRDHLAGVAGAGQVAHGRHDLVNSTTDVVRAAAGLPTLEAACRSSSSTTSTSSPLQLCPAEH